MSKENKEKVKKERENNIEKNGLRGDNEKRAEDVKEKEEIKKEYMKDERELKAEAEMEEEEVKKEQEEKEGEQEKKPEEEAELKVDEILNRVMVLEERIQELEAEKEDNTRRMQRLQADFINYRKRNEKEMAKIHTTALIELVEELLPIIDNFERALEQDDTGDDFRKGIEMIYRQLLSFLDKNGIKPIEAVGCEFDPQYHNAVMQVESEEHEAGIIVEELQKGYILDEHVIRPSMVKVAQ